MLYKKLNLINKLIIFKYYLSKYIQYDSIFNIIILYRNIFSTEIYSV